jgi:adenylate cyclase
MGTLGRQAAATAGTVFLLVLVLRFAGGLERLELGVYDLALRARPAAPLDERFVIIDETEDDLERFGHPLSDRILAQVVERVLAMQPRVLGVDKFRDIPVAPGTEALARTVNASRNVFWIYQFGGNGQRRITAPQWLRPAQAAFNDVLLDAGGTVRRGLLFLDDGGRPQRSFALTLALAYLAPQGIAPRPDANDPARMRLGAASLAPLEAWDGGYAGTDASGYQMLLDYRGAPAGFRRHTLGELLDGKIDETLVRDRIVIVGSSATSLKDFFQTPFSSAALPYVTGSELHAHHASQLLRLADGESRPLRTLPEAIEVVLLALLCLLGLLAWVATRTRSLTGLVVGGLAALGVAWYAAAVSTI